jgi:hypothetical protein
MEMFQQAPADGNQHLHWPCAFFSRGQQLRNHRPIKRIIVLLDLIIGSSHGFHREIESQNLLRTGPLYTMAEGGEEKEFQQFDWWRVKVCPLGLYMGGQSKGEHPPKCLHGSTFV